MAYSQQARYAGPQRPQYGQQEPSYDSSRSRGHTQSAGNQTYGYGDGDGDNSSHHFPDQYGAEADYEYHQHNWSDAPTQYQRNDGYYAGRGEQPHRGGPLDQYWRPGPTDGAGSRSNNPRSQGAALHNARPPISGQHGRQDRHDQLREHRRPPDSRQQRDRYQNATAPQANGEFNYGETFDEPQDDWQAQQGYHQGYDPESSIDHPGGRYQGRQKAPAEHDNGHDQGRVQDTRQSAPHSKYNQPVAPKMSTLKVSSRDGEPKQAKQPPQRLLDEAKSSDTVAWDNPFPTFPAAKAKSKANSEVQEHSRNGDGSSEPHPANDKGNHNSTRHHKGPRGNGNGQAGGQDGRSQPLPGSWNGHRFVDQAQERPSTSHISHSAPRKDHLNTSGLHGRHSEDNRTRPLIANEVPRGSGYERSHTMPTAITDAIVNPHDEMPEVAAWQEPGANAGYYGGEDKDFVSSSPDGIPQQKPMGQLGAHSDESRRHQPKSRFPQQPTQHLPPAPQPHAQHDSLGEVFDSYYHGTPPPPTKPYVKENPYQRRRASLDEMPNFNASQMISPSHGRGMTIDQHLQPQPPSAPQNLPAQDPYADQVRHPTTSQRADPFPRSKSQPDFNGQRSSTHRHPQGQGFNFGVSEHIGPRPTTSSNGRSGPRGQYSSTPSTDRLYQDPYTRDQQYSGAVPGPEQWSDDRARGNGYQDTRQQPDDHRSPPIQNGYGDPRQQDGYRSPSQANGPYKGPGQQDRFWSASQQHGPYQQSGQQDRYRSSPAQNGRPSDDGVRRPKGGSGGPSPHSRHGPTSPPNKPLPNPDALPHHPAPIRPGLIEGSPVNSANKPPPIRQYDNNSSPTNLAGPTEAPGPGRSQEGKQGAKPVTYQELDRLRQKTQASPEDQATRFLLAKNLVEASTVLVNERADQKTREKTREDYVAQALKMLKKLSNNQYPNAMFYLGDCYSRGALGLQSDVKEAFTLYQSSAKANHAQAAYRVAVCCELGQDEGGGTRKDPIKAMQWYKRAAQLGDVPAMYKMGVIQLKGLLGQPRNPREALVFLKKAAERADAENPHALHELALLHEKGSEGIAKDETYSKDLFIQCANLGYKFSQFRLGCAYEYGLMGCPVDPRQSIAWYSKAAVQEEHQSELALSGWYLTGSEGVLQQSDTEAYLWARKAAQAGLAKAEYAMGYFTEVGIGAPANLEDAKRWYWRAASQNFPKARERLEDLRKGGAAKQKTRVSRSHMKKQSDGECTVM